MPALLFHNCLDGPSKQCSRGPVSKEKIKMLTLTLREARQAAGAEHRKERHSEQSLFLIHGQLQEGHVHSHEHGWPRYT